MSSDGKRVFHALDGMRGVAAVVVVVHHTPAFFGFHLGSSHLAVDLFFAVSGFVIAHAYDHRIATGMSVVDFMRRRIIRLYPMFVLGVLILAAGMTALKIVGATTTWTFLGIGQSLILNSLMLPTPSTAGELYPLNTPGWSLLFELSVNLAFVLAWKHLKISTLLGILGLAAAGVVAAAATFGSLDGGWRWSNAYIGFARVGFAFPAGVLIYRLSRNMRAISVSPWMLLAVVVAVLSADPGPHRLVYDVSITLVAFPVIVALGGLVRERPNRAFAHLGLTSYGLYALHVPVFTMVDALLTKALGLPSSAIAPWGGLGVLFLLLVSVAFLDRYYDVPMRQLLERRFRRRPSKYLGVMGADS